MPIELQWKASRSAACLYAIDAVRQGRVLRNSALAAALAEPGEALLRELRVNHIAPEQIMGHLVPQAARIDNNRQLAEFVLRKLFGSVGMIPDTAVRLGGRIADVENSVAEAVPDLLDELANLADPLQRTWELHGPLLLGYVGRLTDERLIADTAEVLVVPATTTGGGAAYLAYNCVSIEPVASNPVADLPEIVRLAWLVAQLQIDLPMFSENILAARRPLVAALAMLPPVLAAAERSRLAHCDTVTMQQAVEHWGIATPNGIDPVDVTERWWNIYCESHPPVEVALAALDRMLGEEG